MKIRINGERALALLDLWEAKCSYVHLPTVLRVGKWIILSVSLWLILQRPLNRRTEFQPRSQAQPRAPTSTVTATSVSTSRSNGNVSTPSSSPVSNVQTPRIPLPPLRISLKNHQPKTEMAITRRSGTTHRNGGRQRIDKSHRSCSTTCLNASRTAKIRTLHIRSSSSVWWGHRYLYNQFHHRNRISWRPFAV